MRVARLFLPCALRPGEEIELPEERAHYLTQVLRLRAGAALSIFNGEGGEYAAEVTAAGRRETRVRIGLLREGERESPLKIDLGLGISRSERMDIAIQKSVELGVSTITPIFTERTVVRLDAERRSTRWEHWQSVARSAAEQCARTTVPGVAEPRALAIWLTASSGFGVLLDPQGRQVLTDLTPPGAGMRLLSGPEGGFSAEERALAHGAGFVSIRMGPRILRAETAAIAALTAVQLLWGDLGA